MAVYNYTRKVTFRLDTGKMNNGKPVYSNYSISRLRPEADNMTVESFVNAVKGLFEPTVVRVTTTKVDLIESD